MWRRGAVVIREDRLLLAEQWMRSLLVIRGSSARPSADRARWVKPLFVDIRLPPSAGLSRGDFADVEQDVTLLHRVDLGGIDSVQPTASDHPEHDVGQMPR